MRKTGKYIIPILFLLLAVIVLSSYWYTNIRFHLDDYDLCYQYEDKSIDSAHRVKVGIYCKISAGGYFSAAERVNNTAQYIDEYGGLPQSYHDLHWALSDTRCVTYFVIAWMEQMTPATDGITSYQYDHLIAIFKAPSQQYTNSLPDVKWIDHETLSIEGHAANIYHGRYDYRSLFNKS